LEPKTEMPLALNPWCSFQKMVCVTISHGVIYIFASP